MDRSLIVDTETSRPHCGLAITGPGAGNCANPRCGKRDSTLFGGYCVSCFRKHGIEPLNVNGPQPTGETCTADAHS